MWGTLGRQIFGLNGGKRERNQRARPSRWRMAPFFSARPSVREFPSSTCFNFFSFGAALISLFSFKYPESGALMERGVGGGGGGGKMNAPSNSILPAELLSRA